MNPVCTDLPAAFPLDDPAARRAPIPMISFTLRRFICLSMALSVVGAWVGFPAAVRGAEPSTAQASKPSPGTPEEKFRLLFTEASLSGRWAPLKDGVLGEEKDGDKYHIVSVSQREGDQWIVNARMKFRDQELVVPIPVQIQFIGDSILLMVNDLSTPGGGMYSARLLIHDRTYSGSWKGARGGGMLYGTISNKGD